MTWTPPPNEATTFHYRQPGGEWTSYTRTDRYIRPCVVKEVNRTPMTPCPASHGH